MFRLFQKSDAGSVRSPDFWCQLIVFYELAGEKLCCGILSKGKDGYGEIHAGLEKLTLHRYSSMKSIDGQKFTLSTFITIMKNEYSGKYCETANYLQDERFKLFSSNKIEYTFEEYKNYFVSFEKMCKTYWEEALGNIKFDLTSLKNLKEKVRFF